MSRAALSLSILTLFVLGTGAAHAETAQVSVKIAELRAKPSADARSKLKLGRNRSVDVLSKSDDGQWVKIRAEVLRGDEPVNFEGWVAAAHLGIKGASEPVSSGSGSSSGSGDAWGDEGSTGSSDVAKASSDLDWATETPAPAAAPAESWESPAASTDSPSESPSVDAWGDGGSDAPAAADSSASSDDPESDW